MLLILPFGVYHSIAEPYVTGHLWGHHLPVGYVGFLSGIIVIFYPQLAHVEKLRLGSIMALAGLFLLLSLFFFPKIYSINLLHNTSFDGNQIDIDYSIGTSVVWGLSLLSILVGLFLRLKRKTV
jgi:hypothetical protein